MLTATSGVVVDANAQQAKLLAMNADIDAKIHDIIAAATPGVGLSKDDFTRIQNLRKQQATILIAIQELALVMAASLDDDATLDHLAASLKDALHILKSASDDIAGVSARCAQIVAVCGGISDVIDKLTTLIGQKKS